MIFRPAIGIATAALALVGSASAASMVVSVQPTLAAITVHVPECGEESQTPDIPVSWTPERDCSDIGEAPAAEPAPASPVRLSPTDAHEPVDSSTPAEITTEASEPEIPSSTIEPDGTPPEPGEGEPDSIPPAAAAAADVPAPTNAEEAPHE